MGAIAAMVLAAAAGAFLQGKDKKELERLELVAPEAATEAQLGEVVKGLAGRLKECAVPPDVTVEIEPAGEGKKRVVVKARKVTKPLRELVEKLVAMPGRDVEIRFQYTLSAEEKKRFGKGTAPPGAKVFGMRDELGRPEGREILLRDAPVVAKGSISRLEGATDTSEGNRLRYYEIDETMTRQLIAHAVARSEPAVMVVDGVAVSGPGAFSWRPSKVGTPYRRGRYVVNFNPLFVEASLMHPLPFALTVPAK